MTFFSKDHAFAIWLKLFALPLLVASLAITTFQFLVLYPQEVFVKAILWGPGAFHFVILELLVGAGVCQLIIFGSKSFPRLQKLITGLSLTFMGLLLVAAFIQFCSLYLTSDFLATSSLTTTTQVGLVASPFLFGTMIATVFLPLGIISLGWLRFREHTKSLSPRAGILQFLSHGFLCLIVMQSYHLRRMRDLKWEFPAYRKPPIQAFFATLKEYFGKDEWSFAKDISAGRPVDLSSQDLETLTRFGLQIQKTASFPLVQNQLYLKPLNKIDHTPLSQLPYNVIVIFTESLSARLLGAYGSPLTDLTPHIDHFSSRALVVDGYVNHAFPTIPALTGTFCSIFPQFSHTDWNRAKAKLGLPPLFCLPKLLLREGYDTVYLGYSHPRETFFRDQMIDFGFVKTYFYDELTEQILGEEPEHGALGNSDYQMFAALKAKIMQLKTDKPFFISMSTIETHMGMDVTKRGKKYQSGENTIFNTLHNFDHHFGTFLNWLEGSSYADQTIVILTADHAHPPSLEFASTMDQLGHTDYQKVPFDDIPLIIKIPHAPPVKLMVASSSLDFAPTISHLLAIKNQPNHFLGKSIFELKEQNLPRVGIVDGRRLMIYEDQKVNVLDLDPVRCLKNNEQSSPCSLMRGIYYIFEQMTEKKIWNSGPWVK